MLRLIGALIVLNVYTGSTQAAEPSVAEFYRGKTLVMLVGSTAGGGYDLYARLLARHIGKYIPGNPTVIVQNMPGASGLSMSTYLYNAAPKDGTVVGILHQANFLLQVVRDPAVRIDVARFNWLGNMAQDNFILYVRSDSGVTKFDDTTKVVVKLGTHPPGDPNHFVPMLLNGLLGTRFTIVAGYPGVAEMLLAIERGEVQGTLSFWSTLKTRRPDWLTGERPYVNVLVQLGLSRHPDLSQIPLLTDLPMEERSRQVFKALSSLLVLTLPFAAPPGVPSERVAALRQAFLQTLRDPDLQAEARSTGITVEAPMGGEEVSNLVQVVLRLPEEQVELLRRYWYGQK